MDQLADDVSPDYWEATEGNAKKALAERGQTRTEVLWIKGESGGFYGIGGDLH